VVERIEGRSSFVTGGASGIGLAVAEALVAGGARVTIADWNQERLDSESSRLGPAAVGVQLDVRDRDGWQRAKSVAEDAHGPVEILVNNAGVAPDQNEFADMPPEHFDRLVAIMLTGVFNGVNTFGAGMRERREGHIVNTASMAGLMASARLGAYTAAKFGTVGLSEVLRAEMESYGVGVSVLCPGLVRTNLGSDNTTATPEQRQSAMLDGIDPALVATQVLEAIRRNDLYIITHGEYGPVVARRAERIQKAFDEAPNRGGGEDLPGTDIAKDPSRNYSRGK
jgi:NAD(P)-dependent dehydrogenase (short-subunit alcohol dehydrogenase family)